MEHSRLQAMNGIFFDAYLRGDSIRRAEANARDVFGKSVRVFADDLNRILAVLFVDLRRV